MKRLGHFIFSHSIFVSFCAAALTYQTYLLHHVAPVFWICMMVFSFTLAGYNAYWLISKRHFNKQSWIYNFRVHKGHLAFILIGGIAGLILSLLFVHSTIPLAITALFSVMYCLPLIDPFSSMVRKMHGWLKMVLLAMVWTCATVLIPLSDNNLFTPEIGWIMLHRFSFILMLNIIFDVGDVTNDRKLNIYTFATENSRVKIITLMALVSVIYLSSTLIMQERTHWNAISLPLIALLMPIWYLFLKSFREKKYLFYYGITDGMMLCSAVLIYLTRNL